jgi:hypothetical protein
LPRPADVLRVAADLHLPLGRYATNNDDKPG